MLNLPLDRKLLTCLGKPFHHYEEFCPNWVSIKLFVVALIGHNVTPMRALPKTPPAKRPQIYERQNQQKLQKLEFAEWKKQAVDR